MKITLDINNMLSDKVGAHGLTAAELEGMSARAAQARQAVQANRGTGMMGWTELPYNQKEIVEDVLATAKQIADEFDNFVVLGIGGSALGPIAVQQALNHLHYNDLPREKRGPRFFVEENVDPERMQALFDIIDVKKTCFNVITKSGSTSETMSQYLIIIDLLKKALGENAAHNIIATTDAEKGNLIKIARQEGFKTFVIPAGVGGRFSELCPVGLLPAAVCGIEIEGLLKGAAMMDEMCQSDEILANPALAYAVTHYLAMEKGKNILVMMPYADSLKYISGWFVQLWAESLGKRYNLKGEEVYVGQTPLSALGVTDQHSQVQLYSEGPFDKCLTFLAVGEYRDTVEIAHGYEDIPDVSFLGGHTMNELISAERKATEYAIMKAGKMNCTITLPEVNALTIGQLLYMLELATAYCGELMGINTFDQPGVEEGKNATYALLGRRGYDEKRAELAAMPEKDAKYII